MVGDQPAVQVHLDPVEVGVVDGRRWGVAFREVPFTALADPSEGSQRWMSFHAPPWNLRHMVSAARVA